MPSEAGMPVQTSNLFPLLKGTGLKTYSAVDFFNFLASFWDLTKRCTGSALTSISFMSFIVVFVLLTKNNY